jgi:hypothetical protein
LSLVNWRDGIDGLDFYHHGIFHKNVDPEAEIDSLTIVIHR